MIDIGILLSLENEQIKNEPMQVSKLISKEDRYGEICDFLFLSNLMGILPSESEEIFLKRWISYVNKDVEDINVYIDLKKAISAKYGSDFFEFMLFNHGHLLQRTIIRNKILSGERKSYVL